MKKVLSMLLLAALLMTMVALPVSAETKPMEIEQSPRDDVLILFDGSTDNVEMQHPTTAHTEFYEDDENYIQGGSSLFVDMPTTEDCAIQFIGNFALMLKIKNDEPVSVEEYPISELSVYNHQATRKGDAIQINYVDPDNSAGAGDDSYNKTFGVDGWEEGSWHRLTHTVQDAALWGDLDPTNISHMRVSWTTVTTDGAVDYQEIDWNFDCLIVAKQSFFDARAVAEEEMIGIINALEIPTADNIDSVKESIQAAKEKLDDYLYEFPNFLVESTDTIAKMDEIWLAYQTVQAQAAADSIMAKINGLGEITLENLAAKMAEIEAIDAEIDAYNQAGYSKKLINTDALEAARVTVGRLSVEVSIDALPATDAVTAEDIEKINEVKTALAALNAEQQALIPQEKKDKLSALTAKIVENKINALPALDALTLEDEESINAVKTELAALTEAEKALVSKDATDKLAALEAKMDELKNPYTLGMVNDDENIDASDALMALQHSVRLITLADNDFKAADVDANDTVDATDALYILQYSVKLIDKFPAEK